MSSPLGLTNKDFTHRYGSSTAPYNSVISEGKFYYRPPSGGNANKLASSSSKVHRPGDNDDVYDVSTNSIINYTQKDGHEAMQLRATDFVYLRDLGVYPNNRLIVARRFPTPVSNDLTAVNQKPLSTLIGWVSEDDTDFGIKGLEFNEVWERGEGSLADILKQMFGSKEVGGGVSGVVGSIASAAKSAVPLPGATRALQYKLLEQLGFRDQSQNIPEGNPNFIQESKKRKTIDTSQNDSALSSNFSIELKTTYEQKMINNVDPTLVFLDVIGNILRFGTSKSEFFLNGQGGDTFKKFFKKFQQGKWVEAISIIIKVVKDSIGEIINTLGTLLGGGDDSESGTSISDTVGNLTEALGEGIIAKYKVQIASVISAWTGTASAPWHVTIGNPKQPFFSSGDMVCEKVALSFGTVLSFNDLPSTITVTTTLTPARNLGLQEIFERFNTGAGRSYVALSDSFESNNAGTYWRTNREVEETNRNAEDVANKNFPSQSDIASGNI